MYGMYSKGRRRVEDMPIRITRQCAWLGRCVREGGHGGNLAENTAPVFGAHA